jgi:hypothetical protein
MSASCVTRVGTWDGWKHSLFISLFQKTYFEIPLVSDFRSTKHCPRHELHNCILRQTRCYYGDEINKRESAGHVAHMQNMRAVWRTYAKHIIRRCLWIPLLSLSNKSYSKNFNRILIKFRFGGSRGKCNCCSTLNQSKQHWTYRCNEISSNFVKASHLTKGSVCYKT